MCLVYTTNWILLARPYIRVGSMSRFVLGPLVCSLPFSHSIADALEAQVTRARARVLPNVRIPVILGIGTTVHCCTVRWCRVIAPSAHYRFRSASTYRSRQGADNVGIPDSAMSTGGSRVPTRCIMSICGHRWWPCGVSYCNSATVGNKSFYPLTFSR